MFLQMSLKKSELRATLLLTLCVVCLLPAAAAAAAAAGAYASSPHHHDDDKDDAGDQCPSDGVAADCQACGDGSPDPSFVDRCCRDVLSYAACRDHLAAAESRSPVVTAT